MFIPLGPIFVFLLVENDILFEQYRHKSIFLQVSALVCDPRLHQCSQFSYMIYKLKICEYYLQEY